MNERIRKLRKALDLTQAEFAGRIGVKRNTVATYEMGRNVSSDAAVNLICREFNVNEAWLRTGSGEMFRELSRDQEIAAFFDDVLRDEKLHMKRLLELGLGGSLLLFDRGYPSAAFLSHTLTAGFSLEKPI